MLCNLCQSIDWDVLDQEYNNLGFPGFPHHLNFADLSSCTGCEFCSAIASAILSNTDLQTGDQSWREHHVYLRVFPSSDAIGDESDKSNLLIYCTPNPRNELDQKTLVFFGLRVERTDEEWRTGKVDGSNSSSKFIAGRHIPPSSASEQSSRLASTWLHQCLNNHGVSLELHGLTSLTSFMPTRTIDVGPPDGTSEPRLVDNFGTYHEWVTLSHCWGGSSPLKTELNVLAQRKLAMPLNEMPQTFQDAVIITRKLGFRHLWIDSLCIVQDSTSDWLHEAALMGDVYRYGVLNIAADTGSGCHSGIFQHRGSQTEIRLPLRSNKHGIDSHMYVRLGRWDAYQPGVLGDDSKLSSRGWVLQESVLSPRTLHYSKQQMFWECEHFTHAEGNIAPIVDANVGNIQFRQDWVSNKMVIPISLRSNQPRISDKSRYEAYFCWMLIVKGYTARNLTFPSDIFAALGGVASVFQKKLGDRYLAGLFEGDLPASLLWSSVSPQTAQKRTAIHVPTWSWASIVGPVTPEVAYRNVFYAPKVVGSHTATVVKARTFDKDGFEGSNDHFTGISSGVLKLEGYLMKQNLDLESLCYARKDHPEFYHESDNSLPNFQTFEQRSIILDVGTDLTLYENARLATLHIGVWEWWAPKDPNRMTWVSRRFGGLLLREIEGGRWERIGVVRRDEAFVNVEAESLFRSQDDEFIKQDWEKAMVTII